MMADNSEIEEALSDTDEMEYEYDSDETVMSEDIYGIEEGSLGINIRIRNNQDGDREVEDSSSSDDIQIDQGSPIIGSQRQAGTIRREPSVEILVSDEEPQPVSGREQSLSSEIIATSNSNAVDENQVQEVQVTQEVFDQEVGNRQPLESDPELSEHAETPEELPVTEQTPATEQIPELEQTPAPEQVQESVPANPIPGPSGEVTPKKSLSGPPPVPTSPESDDEGQICSICFEPWGNSGNHRLASLKCGHIFGFSCIERWLKGKGGKCPQCNAKATKKDIRVLYAKSLKVLDTSERDRIIKELEKERESKRKLELEHAQTKLKYELKAQLVEKLQEELRMLNNSVSGSSIGSTHKISLSQGVSDGVQKKFRLVMHSALEIIKDGGCRVMAYNEWLGMMVVSLPSQVAMFPGYGVKKINVLDMKTERYVPIHQKQIRDLAFNPAKNDLLLSVALDKLVKITNICNNTTVGSFTVEAPLWSCCWNADQVNQFFVGTATGSVMQYDTSNMNGPIKVIKLSGSGPIVSMCYIPYNASANFCFGGLLVARLQSVSFLEIKDEGFVDHPLPFDGPFTSVSFEAKNRHILISCRPSQRYPHARHIICELQSVSINNDNPDRAIVITGNIIHTFRGGTTQKVLSRSVIINNPVQPNGVLVCASDESTQSTCVWDLSSMLCAQQLKSAENVIDIVTVNCNQSSYLALLTDKSVKFYKWVEIL